MKALNEFQVPIKFIFTDIDDTLTDEGRLGPEAYEALWRLHRRGLHVVPVTGRPAGWCEMIARLWPVSGVIGENGGFYFRHIDQKMRRVYLCDEKSQQENRTRLKKLQEEVLQEVPGSALASDQFCRLLDLAIDFCEDVPRLPESDVQKIVDICLSHGAVCKVSSIHVNAWYGDYDKFTTVKLFLEKEFGLKGQHQACAFVGDSPNDEPLFAGFEHSFGVANVLNFPRLKSKPKFVASKKGGLGFTEIAQRIEQVLDSQGL